MSHFYIFVIIVISLFLHIFAISCSLFACKKASNKEPFKLSLDKDKSKDKDINRKRFFQNERKGFLKKEYKDSLLEYRYFVSLIDRITNRSRGRRIGRYLQAISKAQGKLKTSESKLSPAQRSELEEFEKKLISIVNELKSMRKQEQEIENDRRIARELEDELGQQENP